MIPYKLQMFKDSFTNESAASMYQLYINKGYDTGRAIAMVLSNLSKGILDTGQRKISANYNLSKYSDEEYKNKLDKERKAREIALKPKSLPKETWIQKGLFDDAVWIK